MRTMMMLLVVTLGCAASHEPATPCEALEGAFYDRAIELGCSDAYPLEGCPSASVALDCIERQTDQVGSWYAEAETCEDLHARGGRLEAWTCWFVSPSL